jgi:hypothetical protein
MSNTGLPLIGSSLNMENRNRDYRLMDLKEQHEKVAYFQSM